MLHIVVRRNNLATLVTAFWWTVAIIDIFILVVLIEMQYFHNYSVLYWFMDATCGGCGK
jgi:hypothetical protein